jgi:hypothetical protein
MELLIITHSSYTPTPNLFSGLLSRSASVGLVTSLLLEECYGTGQAFLELCAPLKGDEWRGRIFWCVELDKDIAPSALQERQ